MNIKHRKSVQRPSSHTSFDFYWHPHPSQPHIFYHRFTHKQIQAHYFVLPLSQIKNQIEFITGRINNKHPNVCCAHFYQLIHRNGEHQKNENHEKVKQQQICVYTDRMIPLEEGEWNSEHVMAAVAGVKRLVMVYGPFRATQRLIGKDQQGQIKVWISSKPYKNQPDHPLFMQHQTVLSLLQLLQLKNKQLYSTLSACQTLREIIQRISKRPTSSKTGQQNRHRYTPSISINTPEVQTQREQESHRGKSNSYAHLVNGFWSSQQGFYRPHLQLSPQKQQEQHQGHGFPNRTASFMQNKTPKNQFHNNTMTANPSVFTAQHQQDPYESFRDKEPHNIKYFPSPSQPRFATGTFRANHKPTSSFSQRGGAPTWRYEHTQPPFHPPNSYDITIINNNVSNYIHYPHKGQQSPPHPKASSHAKQAKQQYRHQSYDKFYQSLNNWKTVNNNVKQYKSRSPSPQRVKNRRKAVPSFITIRQQTINSHAQSYQNSNQNTRLIMENDAIQEIYPEDVEEKQGYKRKNAKIFTFCVNPKDLPPPDIDEEYTEYVPKSKTPKAGTAKNDISTPGRTKAQSNFFTAQKHRKISISDPKISQRPSQTFICLNGNPLPSQLPSDTNKGKSKIPMDSGQLRRLLKEQYKNLLDFGSDIIVQQQKKRSIIEKDISHSSSAQKLSLKQSMLQDKIKNKQLAFAQLKKQALKVLSDL